MSDKDYSAITEVRYTRIVRYICEAAVDLVSKYPADVVTIKMITTKSEVSKQTFYNHFVDKYALYDYIFYHDINDVLSEYTPHDVIVELLPRIFREKMDFYKSLALVGTYNNLYNFFFDYMNDYFYSVVEEYYGKENVTPTIAFGVKMFSKMTVNCFMLFLREDETTSQSTLEEMGRDIFASVPESIAPAIKR